MQGAEIRVGVFSDVHSNSEALLAILDRLRAEGVRRFICCGDVVGYGPDPAVCISILRDIDCRMVAGNHDHGVLGKTPIEFFNRTAAEALLWNREQLSVDDRSYLEGLPLVEEVLSLHVVHAAPSHPAGWEYVFTAREAEEEMSAFATEVCVIGHTHYPFAVERLPGEHGRPVQETRFELRPGAKYVVNVGSVGQPRDGDPRACCVVCDLELREVRFIRVGYDISTVQKKVRAAGLPEFLATRLASGR